MATQGLGLTYINSSSANNVGGKTLFPPFLGQEAEAQISETICSRPTLSKEGIQTLLRCTRV